MKTQKMLGVEWNAEEDLIHINLLPTQWQRKGGTSNRFSIRPARMASTISRSKKTFPTNLIEIHFQIGHLWTLMEIDFQIGHKTLRSNLMEIDFK